MRSCVSLLILSLAILTAFSSCGEDRTHEYEGLTRSNHAMYDFMKEVYLWNEDMTELEWNNFFGNGNEFFSRLTTEDDKWSFATIDTLQSDPHARGHFNHFNSYGLDFNLVTDPTGKTNRQLFRISLVVPHSPAEKAGLQRNDFISAVDGSRAGSSLADKLVKGDERQLTVLRLTVGEESGELQWKDTLDITLPSSTYVEDKPFPIRQIMETSLGKTAYLMCMRLTEGPWETDSSSQAYSDELDKVFAEFHSQGATDLVLDLRYCNDGALPMVQKLASYIAGDTHHGESFLTTFRNTSKAGNNQSIPFDKSLVNGHALGLSRVAVITSSQTQGAGEWLTHGLKAVFGDAQVITVGQTTAGCNVVTEDYHLLDHITIHPAVAYVADKEGNGDYATGIKPSLPLGETNYYLTTYPLGDIHELWFEAALNALAEP